MGKKGVKRKKYSAEFKTGVIVDMRENDLSYRETARKYWKTKSRGKEDNYRKTL
jgi:transposase-like protein